MIVKITHDKGEKISIHDAQSVYVNKLAGNKADVNVFITKTEMIQHHFDDFSPFAIEILQAPVLNQNI